MSWFEYQTLTFQLSDLYPRLRLQTDDPGQARPLVLQEFVPDISVPGLKMIVYDSRVHAFVPLRAFVS